MNSLPTFFFDIWYEKKLHRSKIYDREILARKVLQKILNNTSWLRWKLYMQMDGTIYERDTYSV